MQICGAWPSTTLADSTPRGATALEPLCGGTGDTRTDAESLYLSASASEPSTLQPCTSSGHVASQDLQVGTQAPANALQPRKAAPTRSGRSPGMQPVKLQRLNAARSGERANVWSMSAAAAPAPASPLAIHSSCATTAAPPPRFATSSVDTSPGKARSISRAGSKACANSSDLLETMLPYTVTNGESVGSDATTVVPEPTVADNPATMALGVRWAADAARVPPWWHEEKHTAVALQRVNQAEILLKDEAPKKVDRATTRQMNDRLGIDAEARKRMQTERNRQTARAAAQRRRQAADTLEDMVRAGLLVHAAAARPPLCQLRLEAHACALVVARHVPALMPMCARVCAAGEARARRAARAAGDVCASA